MTLFPVRLPGIHCTQAAALCRAPRTEADMAGNAINDTSLVDVARQSLPFRLTGAQDRALAEILDDMAYPAPMARLLQVRLGPPGDTPGVVRDDHLCTNPDIGTTSF